MTAQTKLLTVDEVTEIWGCHRNTVLRLMRRGALRAARWVGGPRFDRTEITLLKNNRIAVYPHFILVSKLH
jgi:excisionase family DNA binding protein